MDEVLDVLEQTADGVYAVNQEQQIVFWNAAAERIFGYQADEVIGRPCHEIFHGVPRPGCVQCDTDCPILRAASSGDQVETYNLLSRTKAGEAVLLPLLDLPKPRQTAYYGDEEDNRGAAKEFLAFFDWMPKGNAISPIVRQATGIANRRWMTILALK